MQRILSTAITVFSRTNYIANNLRNALVSKYSILHNLNGERLLPTFSPIINPVCSLKVRGKVKRRCRSCYFVYRQERLYIMCSEHPRHKQVQRALKPLNTWILTHASQSKIRPW